MKQRGESIRAKREEEEMVMEQGEAFGEFLVIAWNVWDLNASFQPHAQGQDREGRRV